MTYKEVQYNGSALDKQRIVQYARKVANAIGGVVPMETFQQYTSTQREEVQRTGWFSRKRVTVMDRAPQGSPVRYWEVGRIVGKLERKHEGLSVYGHIQHYWTGIEDGALIILMADGELRYVDYKVYTSGKGYPSLKIGDLHTDWKMSPMRDGDFLMVDRANFGRVRERSFNRKDGILFEEELQLNFRVAVDQKGLGLSLALNRLMKRGN